MTRPPVELTLVVFALVPVLGAATANPGKVAAEFLLRPLLIASVLPLMLVAVANLWTRERTAACLAVAGATGLFYCPGPIIGLAPGGLGFLLYFGAAAGLLLASRPLGPHLESQPRRRRGLQAALWIAAAALGGPVGYRAVALALAPAPLDIPFPAVPAAAPPEARPDILWVVADGYGRDDVLATEFGVDTGGFLRSLAGSGFRVLPEARSSYPWTAWSMASTFNLGHPALPEDLPRDSADYRAVMATLEDPVFFRRLRQAGYQLHLVRSGLDLFPGAPFDVAGQPGPSEFEHHLLTQTSVGYLRPDVQFQLQRDQLRAAVAGIGPVEAGPPRFTLVHLSAPHPPFLFRADGTNQAEPPYLTFFDIAELIDSLGGPGFYRRAYAEQVAWLSGALAPRLAAVRAGSRPTLVVLQGDHGPRSHPLGVQTEASLREHFGILLAVAGPEALRAKLAPDATPMDVARTVLGDLLSVPLPAQPYRAFAYDFARPYNLVPMAVPAGRAPALHAP